MLFKWIFAIKFELNFSWKFGNLEMIAIISDGFLTSTTV